MTDAEAGSPFAAFGEHARRALVFARLAAIRRGGAGLDDVDLLLGVLQAQPQAIVRFVESTLWTAALIETRLEALTSPGPSVPVESEVPFSPAAVRAITVAAGRQRSPGHDLVPEHLVWALMDDPATPVVRLLAEAGVTRAAIEAFLDQP